MNWEHTELGRASDYATTRGIFIGSQVFAIAIGAYLADLADVNLQAILAGKFTLVPVGVTVMLAVSVLAIIPTFRTLEIHAR